MKKKKKPIQLRKKHRKRIELERFNVEDSLLLTKAINSWVNIVHEAVGSNLTTNNALNDKVFALW